MKLNFASLFYYTVFTVLPFLHKNSSRSSTSSFTFLRHHNKSYILFRIQCHTKQQILQSVHQVAYSGKVLVQSFTKMNNIDVCSRQWGMNRHCRSLIGFLWKHKTAKDVNHDIVRTYMSYHWSPQKSVAFATTIFMQLTNAKHYVVTLYTKFHQNQTMSAVWIEMHWF